MIHTPADDVWRVLGYDEASRCALDQSVEPVVSSTKSLRARLVGTIRQHQVARVQDFFEGWVSELSAGAHRRVRKAVNRGLTRRLVTGMRPEIQRIAEGLFAAVADHETFDFIRAVASPLPMLVLGRLVGMPMVDLHKLKAWGQEIIDFQANCESVDALEGLYDAILEMEAYFGAMIADRRRNPSDDLISEMLEAGTVSDAELITNLGLFSIAGHETTTGLIGNGVHAMMQHPEQFARLRRDPGLGSSAVLECLRFEPPTQFSGRITTAPVRLADRLIPADRYVHLVWAAANRDPRQFEAPERLDIGRNPTRHLAMGSGVHRCPGALLARIEAEVVFDILARRSTHLVPGGSARWVQSPQFRILSALPVCRSR